MISRNPSHVAGCPRRHIKNSTWYTHEHALQALLSVAVMSGDLLRRRAVCGEVDEIKALLEDGANPCSVDVSLWEDQKATSAIYSSI